MYYFFRERRSLSRVQVLMRRMQDEIDALAASRSLDSNSSNNGILTSLLNEMDGVQDSRGVVVVGATNRPQVIVRSHPFDKVNVGLICDQDSAMMRPGRLDRLIYIGPPSHEDRIEIIGIKMKGMA